MSSHQQSQIPTHFHAISRNNSNASTTSSSNRGDLSSTISTANSVTSFRSQLSKNPLIDHRQLFATCGTSTPIRSFQRATISSAVKTRAFDNNPALQDLLIASPSGQSSVSNSQTTSPRSTPLFSRSRSLRMSSGPSRYHQSPIHQRTSSRTPDLYSFNSSNMSNCSNDSQIKLNELTNERHELKESLEFLECERQVLIDSAKELKDTLQKERSLWKKEQEDLKRQVTELMAARVRAESQLTQKDMELNDMRHECQRISEELAMRKQHSEALQKNLETSQNENKELFAINIDLKRMLAEKIRYNGTKASQQLDDDSTKVDECISVVTEMAKLRLELNEKDKIIENLKGGKQNSFEVESQSPYDMDALNRFLDETVECIKSWPEELSSSSHVQNLMKTLLSAHKTEHEDLILKFGNIHL